VSLLAEVMGGKGQKYRILLLAAEREISREDVADSFGITVQAAGKELKELREMFLLEVRVRSNRKVYGLTELGRTVLESIRGAEQRIVSEAMESALKIAERRLSELEARMRLASERAEKMRSLGRDCSTILREIERMRKERELLIKRIRKMGLER
jgi:predicted ArsR family transcriptional regulator